MKSAAGPKGHPNAVCRWPFPPLIFGCGNVIAGTARCSLAVETNSRFFMMGVLMRFKALWTGQWRGELCNHYLKLKTLFNNNYC